MNTGSWSPAANQHVVKPFQTVTLPILSGGRLHMFVPWKFESAAADGLSNAKIAITAIGRYRNANTITAHAVNDRFAVRNLRTEAFLLRGEQDVQDD